MNNSIGSQPAGKNSTKRVLLLYGGWEGHQPAQFADFAENKLLNGFEVVRSQNLESLHFDILSDFDLLLPIWTFGALTEKQEMDLQQAISNGLGMVGWHGNASSFLENRPHKLLLGGQFVGHPGGNEITYSVHFHTSDPMVEGLKNITITSEQYYLLIDPAVKILASTEIDGAELTWLKGVKMPVAWKRNWGSGRVFYCALGHTIDVLDQPEIIALLTRAINWAVRK